MTYVQQLVQTNPTQAAVDESILVECIEACFDCAQACTACADACLGEQDIQTLIRCIRLCLDCTEVCEATGKILSRQTAFDAEMARACRSWGLRSCMPNLWRRVRAAY